MKTGMIIYGFPAIGKTTVCKKYENFLDLESSDYHWTFTKEQLKMGVEERKGIEKSLNPNWPQNYYDAIDEAIKKYDYVFVAFAGIQHCIDKNLPYMRIFPTLDQKEEYLGRMRARGNDEKFVEKLAENFDNYITTSQKDENAIKVEMQPREYLEDCLKRIGIINEKERDA